MSRIRSIHPGFFTDESFVQVSAHARLLLLGLGVEADDKGTFPWKPVTLKMRLFPMDVVDIQELLKELTNTDAIRRYIVDGKEYGAIRNFRVHQRPKKPNDINPLPDELRTYSGLTDDSSEPVPPRWGKVPADGGEGRGEEDVGEDGEESRGRVARARGPNKSPCPEDFTPSPSENSKTALKMAGWSSDKLETQTEKFIAHHRAKANRFADWQRAWTTWVLNGFDDEKGNGNERSRNGFLDATLERERQSHPGKGR